MRLTVVGSGTAAPHPERVCAGYWVEAGDVRLLLDCGNGVLHRFATLGLPWATVTHVALTHFHYDHVGDLPALIMALHWGQMTPRTQPLTIMGPVGTRAWIERLRDAVGAWLLAPGSYDVIVNELDAGSKVDLSASGPTLSAHRVPHTPESVAYSVTRARARLVYTGDTGDDEALATWASGCDVLLAECSLPAALAIPEHLTPESAAVLAARAQPGRLVLTHFYPPVEHENIEALVRARWPGPLVLARDGTVIELPE